jgi:hypothetical protein
VVRATDEVKIRGSKGNARASEPSALSLDKKNKLIKLLKGNKYKWAEEYK